MMVGHTHEEIDQMFSCLSRYLCRHDALTIPGLHAAIRASYTPMPKTEHLDRVIDYKEQLDNGVVEGIAEPHVFKFVKEGDDVALYYKDWPLSSDPYTKLDISSLIGNNSNFMPILVRPARLSVLTTFTDQLLKLQPSGSLTQEVLDWWKQYCATAETKTHSVNEAAQVSTLPEYSIQRPSVQSYEEEQFLRRRTDKVLKRATLRVKPRRAQHAANN